MAFYRIMQITPRVLLHPNDIKSILTVVLAFMLLVAGCVSIPAEDWVISSREPLTLTKQAAGCAIIGPVQPTGEQTASSRKSVPSTAQMFGLDAKGFSFVSWNIQKGKSKGWSGDFQKLCRSTDILIFQEAFLTDVLQKTLKKENYLWDLAAAYSYQHIEGGVLTASKIPPSLTCALRDREPITRIFKSILITRYPIADMHQELLVANIHAVNFSTGYKAFKQQLDRLENVLAGHRGPMIVSGDFNTWNSSRMSLVGAMAERMNLDAVSYEENNKSKFLGQPVDHVYYRGLEVKNATIFKVATSDHNPLAVEFKVAEGPGKGT